MRRFIVAVIGLAAVLASATLVEAQFRVPVRTPQAPLRVNNPFGFTNVAPFNGFSFNTFTTFQTPRGTFAPSVPGAFNPSTGGFVPSATGSSMLTSRGVFMPSTGTFVPSANGNLVLTNREVFNPSTGRFTPSSTGNFVFSTRGNLVTPDGRNLGVHLNGLGLVNPLNPFSPVNPINQARFSWLANYRALATATYANALNPYANPYSPMYGYYPQGSPYGGTPYGYMSAGYGGYGNSSPYYSSAPSYGNGAPANYAAPQGYNAIPAYTGNNDENRQNQITLTAFGIPNENGRVQWPLAFRLLPPDLRRDLLDKLEADLQVLATQGAAGKVNPALVNEAKDSVQGLQRWLTEHRVDLAAEAYREADVMLRRIEKTLRRLQ